MSLWIWLWVLGSYRFATFGRWLRGYTVELGTKEVKWDGTVVDGGRSTEKSGKFDRLAIFVRWLGKLFSGTLNERKVERNYKTQGHSVGSLRVGSLDRYRNSSLSLRIIDILIQLQADVLQPRFSQLISAIWLSAVTLHLPWVFSPRPLAAKLLDLEARNYLNLRWEICKRT